jgi:iron(III) transport system substrate-binding protein
MVDGAGYLVIRDKEAASRSMCLSDGRHADRDQPSAVFKAAPNPNAARLFQNWMHSREGQQIVIDFARQYSAHGQTVEKPGVRPLKDIKLMKEDAEGVEKSSEDIKARYTKIFRV